MQGEEGAGVLLAFDALAYDDLRTGRLVTLFDLTRAFGPLIGIHLPEDEATVCERAGLPGVAQGRGGRLDRSRRATRAADFRPAAGSAAPR